MVTARVRAARAADGAAAAGQRPDSAWRRSARAPRRIAEPGPGAWRRSLHPG
ncbi:hypothetical protein ACFQXA_28530 [Nocardiopsis composta]